MPNPDDLEDELEMLKVLSEGDGHDLINYIRQKEGVQPFKPAFMGLKKGPRLSMAANCRKLDAEPVDKNVNINEASNTNNEKTPVAEKSLTVRNLRSKDVQTNTSPQVDENLTPNTTRSANRTYDVRAHIAATDKWLRTPRSRISQTDIPSYVGMKIGRTVLLREFSYANNREASPLATESPVRQRLNANHSEILRQTPGGVIEESQQNSERLTPEAISHFGDTAAKVDPSIRPESHQNKSNVLTDNVEEAPEKNTIVSRSESFINLPDRPEEVETYQENSRNVSNEETNNSKALNLVLQNQKTDKKRKTGSRYSKGKNRDFKSKNKIPLNQESRLAINGEAFAEELKKHLARITNHEVLDLRKRHSEVCSEGDVMPLVNHPIIPKTMTKEQKLMVYREIEAEIKKRNICEAPEDPPLQLQMENDLEIHHSPENGLNEMQQVVENNAEAISVETNQAIEQNPESTLVAMHRELVSHPTATTVQDDVEISNVVIPPPIGFNDVHTFKDCHINPNSFNDDSSSSSLEDEHESDRVSMTEDVSPPVGEKNVRRTFRKTIAKPMSQQYEDYVELRMSLTQKSKCSRKPSKRSLYNKGLSIMETDELEAASSTSAAGNPKSLTSNSRELIESEENIATLPPMSQENHIETANADQNILMNNGDDEVVFKKPEGRAPRSKKPKKSSNVNPEQPLRKSQRTIREPRQMIIWRTIYMEAREKSQKRAEQRRLKESLASSSKSTSRSIANEQSTVTSKAQSSQQDKNSLSTITESPIKSSYIRKRVRTKKKDKLESENSEIPTEHIEVEQQANVEEPSCSSYGKKIPKKSARTNLFENVDICSSERISTEPKTVSSNEPTPLTHIDPTSLSSTKKFRIRVKRLVFSMQSTSSTTQGRLSEIPSVTSISRTQNEPFERSAGMNRIREGESTSIVATADEELVYLHDAESVCVSEVEFQVINGVEYGFYVTEEQGKLAYIKLQPQQMKPKTRLKKYMLSCIVFAGSLNIVMNETSMLMNPGEMFVIAKDSHYQIENVGDTVAVVLITRRNVPPVGGR